MQGPMNWCVSSHFNLSISSAFYVFDDIDSVEDFLKPASEVLKVGIRRHQFISAENITSAIGLPDHFESDEITGSRGTEDAQGLSQVFTVVGLFEIH